MSLMDYTPPSAGSSYLWYPASSSQLTAIHSKAQMLMYGGSAGSLKTDFLIADAVQERDNPRLRGLLLRESFPQLEKNILPRMRELYTQMGAYYVGGTQRVWKFPSGARINLGYLAKDDDIGQYQGNPFSWLGVDESTKQEEKRVRRLLPWLRTTESSLFCRVRLATNPGGVGSPWHIHVFLRGSCPLHFPEDSVSPGAVYRGSRWMSDNRDIPLTVSFIPGKHTDHNLLGDEYVERLKTQEAVLADQLLSGCWCSLEGAYFRFLRPEHKLGIEEAKEQWWHNHLISIDYGFGESSAAAGLYSITDATVAYPRGRMFKIGEMVKSGVGSEDFAKMVVEAYVIPKVGGQERQFTAAFFDPANDAAIGNGKSNMEIMAEVFRAHNVPALKSFKDRVGNAQNAYRRLKSGELVITDRCPMTFKSFTSRMHDPKKPGDVKKVKGDPLDDLYDETVYAGNTFAKDADAPPEVAIAEKLKAMKEDGLDEHSLMIHQIRMQQEAKKAEEPMRVGRTYGRYVKR